jgi:DNA-binding winged helix-turn-helix (wHTH) protein
MRLVFVCDRRNYETLRKLSSERPSIVCIPGEVAPAELGNPDIVILWREARDPRDGEAYQRSWRASGHPMPIIALAIPCPTDDDARELVLERDGLWARIGRRQVQLTPTQFAILEYLARHRGSWCHPAAIIRDVLGTAHQKNTSLVRFHIHKLRTALGEYAVSIYWQRGCGYMLATTSPAVRGGEEGRNQDAASVAGRSNASLTPAPNAMQ